MPGNVSLRNQIGNQAIVPELLRQQNQIINGFLRKMWFGAIKNLHKMGKSAGWQHLTEPYKVTTVRLDRQGISDNVVAVQCVKLNTVHHEKGSQIALPSPSVSWNISTCLLCSFEASCTNDRCSSEGISTSISEPLLLRYSEGIAAIALKK
jgi:hypothetical protein